MKNYFSIVSFILLALACSSPSNKNETKTTLSIIISDSTKNASCVYLTADEKEQPVISWCETDTSIKKKNFFMAYFDENRGSFSSRIPIPIEQNASFHEEGMPKIAIKGNGTIIAVYETSTPTEYNRFAGSVKYIVSTDKGKTWTNPANIHADTVQGKSHSFAAITRLSDGEIGASWLDAKLNGKKNGRPVKFAKTNVNNFFENEIVIDPIACECCRIAIAGDANGKIAVAFRDIINDSIRDMSIATSADNGKTFSSAVPFSNDGWIINGCPHNGPSVTSAGSSIYATWFTGGPAKGVYYCELNNKMQYVTRQLVSDHARFIQLCLLPGGSRVLAFDEKRKEGDKSYNKIVLNRIDDGKIYAGEIEAPESLATYPVIRSFGTNNIAVAWSQDKKIYYSILNAQSINKPIQRQEAKIISHTYTSNNITLFNITDPVCGMRIPRMTQDTTLYQEHIYGFCSGECKEIFLEAPETYAVNK